GGPNWGKDYPGGIGSGIYDVRRLRVVCYDGEDLARPAGTLRTRLFSQVSGGRDLPYLTVDSADRPWLFFRHKQSRRYELPDGRITSQAVWGVYATHYDGQTWAAPTFMPNSYGHNDQRLSVCFTRWGEMWVAYAGDGRTYRSPEPFNNEVYVGRVRVPPGPPVEHVFAELEPDRDPKALPQRRPPPQKEPYEISLGEKTYKLLWGDLHRHTDISWDGPNDGSLQDMYRYAIDAADLDFVATTDHGAGQGREYPWWRTQKCADMYEVRGFFTPLFGYERSVRYPFGHRNVIQPVRGIHPVTVFKDVHGLKGLAPDDTERLWAALVPSQNVVIPHTSATNMGTNWSSHNPELERLVEIHQGARNSYECEGGPKAIAEGTPDAVAQGYAPSGFVWNALGKGYRMGFVSSSDHGSTHLGFAAVFAESRSRQAIFEALKKRRTYAASDFIILDMRMGKHFMGEEFETSSLPALSVRAKGVHSLLRVDVIKNSSVIYTKKGDGKQIEFEFMDA
ncbi:MAG: DUF3604 domain-containing protein, partial [Planctomycetes bacterium]|nr:DUF3604 domain-containing protein [Planctomycetota bacterium]